MTWVAANTGGPNVPYFGYLALAAAAIAASAGIAVMSGPNAETYEPGIVNDDDCVPSVPKIVAFLCCSARFLPNCCALAATCHGRTTTLVLPLTFATSDEKSVTFWLTDSWSTAMPAALKIGVIDEAKPVE